MFKSPEACRDFLDRLGRSASQTGLSVHAWTIMPNHFHLLVEVGEQPLQIAMHRLLTGFSNYYNRRFEHRGHVFMTRYKSILVQKDGYRLELIRYIHLNPLRAGLVGSLAELQNYPWSSHTEVMTGIRTDWYDPRRVLDAFSRSTGKARDAYRRFLEEGLDQAESEEYENGCFLIGRRGIVEETGARVDQRRYDFPGPVLGSRDFARSIASQIEGRHRTVRNRREMHEFVELVIEISVGLFGVNRAALHGGGRKGRISRARLVISRILEDAGLPRMDIARALHVTPSAVCLVLRRQPGDEDAAIEATIRDRIGMQSRA
ncbi:hypothetical protein GX411_05205 [Candidatus Fermentibacteria bacterium]|nr:hypothetical protein [Candidatus Fermentibacteria bacterium]